jgi:LmbE family N-acetylglucosaminyl deacetylase
VHKKVDKIGEDQQPGGAAQALARYGIDSHWFGPAAARRRLLFVYAHPDDETFSNAGTIARYATEGVAVHYACATRGECGSVAPEFLRDYPDVSALRTAEELCAARTLGMAGVHFLGYRDSGMAGTADNEHPAALHQASLEAVTEKIVAVIRLLQPQVVVTFDPYGGYGHPDHIKVHQATVAAFAAAGDATRFPGQPTAEYSAWQPAKLYYAAIGTRILRMSILLMRLSRQDPRRYGENKDVDLVRTLAEASGHTTVISSRPFLEQKERAWHCFASQLGSMRAFERLPRPVRRLLTAAERFIRVVPTWDGGARKERDLFADVKR